MSSLAPMGSGRREQAAVAAEHVVDVDVLESLIEQRGMQEDQSHVSAAGGRHVSDIDIRAAREIVDGMNDIVDA